MRGQMMMAVMKRPEVIVENSIEIPEEVIEEAADLGFDLSLSWLDLEDCFPDSFIDLFDFFDIDIF